MKEERMRKTKYVALLMKHGDRGAYVKYLNSEAAFEKQHNKPSVRWAALYTRDGNHVVTVSYPPPLKKAARRVRKAGVKWSTQSI
jgi:hypothetical protein